LLVASPGPPAHILSDVLAVKSVIRGALSSAWVRQAAVRLAAARHHDLVLVYHRITPDSEDSGGDLVPSVPAALLQRQLEALGDLGDIVPLEMLIAPTTLRRAVPRFAVTFDDDYATHASGALEILRRTGVQATFFLSGRDLHGLGAYWWERLEQLVAEQGRASVSAELGLANVASSEFAAQVERHPELQHRIDTLSPNGPSPLSVAGIRALADAGMGFGFHTLHHRLLPLLDDVHLHAALHTGRSELEALLGRRLKLFAYPHGKADTRVAHATRNAGYQAAWTGVPRPARTADDPYRRGRWEPGPLPVDVFIPSVTIRLHRSRHKRSAEDAWA
jgi:peptidoglycan/xylan/chitin deacetylase (PgdA/CDA1 family)